VKCTNRKFGDVVVVDIDGKLVGGSDTDAFHGLIKALLGEGEKRIVINLEKAPWANSQGIGLLIGALTSVTNAGGKLVLAHVCGRIHDILRVTKLIMIFETFGTLDEAVRNVLRGGPDGAAARVAGVRAITPA
jgi:anti-sigma B factor antagonist